MALTKLSVGANGTLLTADSSTSTGLKWAFPGGGTHVWTTVIKTADESTATDTTLSDDNTLLFTTAANTEYAIRFRIYFSANATPDLKWLVHHSGTTTRIWYKHYTVGTAVALANNVFTTETTTTRATNTDGSITIFCMLQVGASGGTLSFQWAQNTSDGNNTTIQEGSYMEYCVT
jgi:hypothetical protein